MKRFLLPIVITVMCLQVACDRRDPQLQPVDDYSLVKRTLSSYGRLLEALTPKERDAIVSMEQIYDSIIAGDPSFEQLAGAGSAWNYVDKRSGGKYSYMVLAHRNKKVPPEECIFIACPCSMDVKGKMIRLVLTHRLDVIEMDEETFHKNIFAQSQSE